MLGYILGQIVGMVIGLPLSLFVLFYGCRYSVIAGAYYGLNWSQSSLIFLCTALVTLIYTVWKIDKWQKDKWQKDWDEKFGPDAVKKRITREVLNSRRVERNAFRSYSRKVDKLFPLPKE